MKRSMRMAVALETVAIVERGSYEANGRVVDITRPVRDCLEATRYYTPEDLKKLRLRVLGSPFEAIATTFEIVNETTLEGIRRVMADRAGPVAALNIASAKNPGGGFLNGSHAQEESLARSSALHASLLIAREFYDRHRASPSLLYSDAMILSPDCPVFRDDDGTLLDKPLLATFLTSVAPNAGAAADNRPAELPLIPDVFRQRSDYLFALAAAHGYRNLVLGAWGCGVFRNDPKMVASAFADHLLDGAWAGRFDRVVFSVLDTSADQHTIDEFRQVLS